MSSDVVVVPTDLPTDAAAPAAEPAAGGEVVTFSEALIGHVQRLNPILASLNPVDADITGLIFEGLTRINAYGEPEPALAERWVISADGLEYTVFLRQDVLWQDGVPFTAADVDYTMSLLRSPDFPGAEDLNTFWRTVETQVLGQHLVRFRLTQPLGTFLDKLKIGILPEHALRGTGAAQIAVAVAADDLDTLKERVAAVVNETRAWFSLRQEMGELLSRSVGFFSAKRTKEVNLPETTWPVTSRELALMLAPLGYRKLSTTDGVLRGDLEALVDRLGLRDRVRFLGSCSEEAVRAALDAADLFVLPSIVADDGQMEGLPVALMEALACGVPAVSTKLSGIPEIVVDGVTGLLATPGDAASLNATLTAMVQRGTAAVEFADAGRALVSREFDLRESIAALTGLLDEYLPPVAS